MQASDAPADDIDVTFSLDKAPECELSSIGRCASGRSLPAEPSECRGTSDQLRRDTSHTEASTLKAARKSSISSACGMLLLCMCKHSYVMLISSVERLLSVFPGASCRAVLT